MKEADQRTTLDLNTFPGLQIHDSCSSKEGARQELYHIINSLQGAVDSTRKQLIGRRSTTS
jgi:hypothetical protein